MESRNAASAWFRTRGGRRHPVLQNASISIDFECPEHQIALQHIEYVNAGPMAVATRVCVRGNPQPQVAFSQADFRNLSRTVDIGGIGGTFAIRLFMFPFLVSYFSPIHRCQRTFARKQS